jgi:hypothetical protein
LLALSTGFGAVHESSTSVKKYVSPDGALTAIIRSRKVPEATPESKLRVVSPTGNTLARKSYLSEDGEHGFGVVKAEWTPDSQFFVYSLESSGGHQSWHSPVYFFSRKNGRIVNLDSGLKDAVAEPEFKIAPPDKVSVALWFGKRTVTVALSSMRIE